MLLDRLLDTLKVELWGFSVYDIRRGWQLALPPHGNSGLHCLLAGEGILRWGRRSQAIGPRSAIVVPGGVDARIEVPDADHPELLGSGWLEQSADSLSAPQLRRVALGANPNKAYDLRLACAQIRALTRGQFGLFDRLEEPLILQFSEGDTFEAVFVGLSHEQGHDAPGRGRMMEALMNQALILVLRKVCESGQCSLPWLSALEDPRLVRAFDIMSSDLSQPHNLDDLARHSGMSRSSFASHFSKTFGIAPMEFLRRARLQQAQDLLRSSELAVETIARRIGFSSRSAFSRAFKASLGQDPSEWRRAQQALTLGPDPG